MQPIPFGVIKAQAHEVAQTASRMQVAVWEAQRTEDQASPGPEWERVQVGADACPRIPRAFLEEERAAMGEDWYRQEYQCEFVDAVSGAFDRDLMERAVSDRFEPLLIR